MVPHKLSSEETAGYYNQAKTQSLWESYLEKLYGQVYSLVCGQCTQLLQDKMKKEKTQASRALQELVESVVLKQTEDQYPVAVVWEQYGQVYNAKQGNMTSTKWYERFNTKVKVVESFGWMFANDKTLDYSAEIECKA